MKKRIHFAIIPGNPGIVDYYEVFKIHLKNIIPNSEAYTISYEGFLKVPPIRLFSIIEEKNFIKNKLESLLKTSLHKNNITWILIGHSIGAWVLLQILEEWKSNHANLYKKVKGAFFLFPFLALDPESDEQNKLKNFLNNPFLRDSALLAYKFVRILPIPHGIWDRLLLSRSPCMDEEAMHTNRKYFFHLSHIPASVVYLAKTEFETLEKDLRFGNTIRQLLNHEGKIQILYTANDIWAPINQMEYLNIHLNFRKTKQKSLRKQKRDLRLPQDEVHRLSQNLQTLQQPLQTPTPPFPIHYDPQFTHDFCVNRNQSRLMAERISQLVKNFH